MKQAKQQRPEAGIDLGLQIVVMDRGFVYVGEAHVVDGYYLIHNASCVRRWGTAKGLGELAELGPLPNTVLDKSPLVRAERKAVIFCVECNAAAWGKR